MVAVPATDLLDDALVAEGTAKIAVSTNDDMTVVAIRCVRRIRISLYQSNLVSRKEFPLKIFKLPFGFLNIALTPYLINRERHAPWDMD